MKRKILLTYCELGESLQRRLKSGVFRRYLLRSTDEVAEKDLGEVEVMLVDIAAEFGREWLSADKVSSMPKLKFVQSVRAGVDSINFDALPSSVKVCGNVGAYSQPMAEHTLGMILDLAKELTQRNSKLIRGIADYRESLFLKGRVLGVVGAGGIGQAISELAKCLGMKTLGVNTSGRRVPSFDRVYKIGDLDYVLQRSDVVVLALPLTVKTFHLMDAAKLEIMKKDAILINVGRGYVIEEEALYNHLRRHPEFKCGLDVWWHYPKHGDKFVQRFPFLELPNFLGTPHVSGFVPEERQIALDTAIDNIARYLAGKKVRGLASRKDYAGLRELVSQKTR